MPLPAQDLLNPACKIKPGWAGFDAAWYLNRYARARIHCNGETEAALGYYLATGAALGDSPNPLFDEAFYLRRNPDIAELVRAGDYASGFDHFCQHGHRVLSPHFMFDDTAYGRLHEDMALENLDQHGFFGRYDHYLKSGQYEGRIGHFLFDPVFYRQNAIETGVSADEIGAVGPFTHYLYGTHGGAVELPPSIYFDPGWYLENTPGAKLEIARGLFHTAAEHYLCGDPALPRDPVPEFSEAYYREAYHDINNAIEDGYFSSGYHHFVIYGAFELRQPRHDIDLVYYRDTNIQVRDDLNTGAVRDAFAHLRLIGLSHNLPFCPPDSAWAVNEETAKRLFERKARNHLAAAARRKLNFTCVNPAVCVIMVLFNRVELTLLALASLRDNYAGEIELIIADNASCDDTRWLEDYITGAKIIRLPENIGFTRAANLALSHVTARAILYLNNDIELAHAAIASALARLNAAPEIGAVGGKIIRSHGLLQEAGSIIWNDGNTQGYLRDASPLAGEANFVRDVDFCSAVFLLCRTSLLKQLGGFDEAFTPAYYEDTDLCVRIWQAGFRIVYDPAIAVHHLEFGSSANAGNAMALMRRGLKTFIRKHKAFLKGQLEPSPRAMPFARSAGKPRRRVLFMEDTIPLRRLGSGFVRANDIVHGIAAAGYDVTVFPINGAPSGIMNMFGDLPDNVEILHDHDINRLQAFLEARPDYYQLIWVSRTHNLQRILPIFEAANISPKQIPFVLDTEALAATREAAKGVLTNQDFDLPKAFEAEFAGADVCRHVIAVNQTEVDLLKTLGLHPVSVLGTAREPAPTPNGFASRKGLLFVAGIHQLDSPNLDSLHWYWQEILPALQTLMDEVPVLNVVGYASKEIDLSVFRENKHIKLHGAVGDLAPYYNASRVFIAPTRFAAGTPYKIYETASFGLPCVTTTLLGEQLLWENKTHLLTAPATDAKAFAAQIANLYQTESLWNKLRNNALAKIAAEHTPGAFNAAIQNVLLSVCGKSSTARNRGTAGNAVPVG